MKNKYQQQSAVGAEREKDTVTHGTCLNFNYCLKQFDSELFWSLFINLKHQQTYSNLKLLKKI